MKNPQILIKFTKIKPFYAIFAVYPLRILPKISRNSVKTAKFR